MKKVIVMTLLLGGFTTGVMAQRVNDSGVPAVVKSALKSKYPATSRVTWEKEKGNYEANWGGKSGEDMSVQFTPSGAFVEQVAAINPNTLPASVTAYVHEHYKDIKIKEAGLVTDAAGATMYEVEVKGKDLVFSKDGKFLHID